MSFLFHSCKVCCFLFLNQMDNQIVVSDYAQMDRVLREERAYILNLVKQIKKAGCNVLLIQKSILRYVNTSLLGYCLCLGERSVVWNTWKIEAKVTFGRVSLWLPIVPVHLVSLSVVYDLSLMTIPTF